MVAILALALGCDEAKKQPAPKEAAPKVEAEKPAPPKAAAEKPATPKAEAEEPAPPDKATPPATQAKKPNPVGDAIEGTGKFIGDAGKAVIEGGGKVLDGAGKIIIDGGGKVIAGTGQVISGAGAAIGKAVGDAVVTTFAPETIAQNFKLRDLDGRTIMLSDLRGCPVVLVFCTTNYPPCVVELRYLRDVQAKYEADKLRVLAVALDWEGPAVLRRFQREMALNYPLLWDNGEVFKSYTQLSNVPTTFFIDRNGHIIRKRVGFSSATIVTQGGAIVGTSMVELDKAFEKDLQELLKK
jgi:peroxiredoxin